MAYIWAPYAGSEIGSGAGDVDLYEVGPEYKSVCHLVCITNPGMVPVVFKVLGIKSRKFLGPLNWSVNECGITNAPLRFPYNDWPRLRTVLSPMRSLVNCAGLSRGQTWKSISGVFWRFGYLAWKLPFLVYSGVADDVWTRTECLMDLQWW